MARQLLEHYFKQLTSLSDLFCLSDTVIKFSSALQKADNVKSPKNAQAFVIVFATDTKRPFSLIYE